jgi:glycosyltransferase involved in cell wall biosynthesis
MPYPRSCLEALAAGRPVLVSEKIALGRLIAKEGGGASVPPTPEGIVSGIDKLRDLYAAAESPAEKCRALAAKYFSLGVFFSAYDSLYKATIRPPNRRTEKPEN